MVAQSAKIEAGHVYLPKDALFLATFIMELLAFPNGANDDQVDSVSQLLIWMQQFSRQPIPIVMPFVVTRPRDFLG
jgi:predicted phage terminase large subunit-like protein